MSSAESNCTESNCIGFNSILYKFFKSSIFSILKYKMYTTETDAECTDLVFVAGLEIKPVQFYEKKKRLGHGKIAHFDKQIFHSVIEK